MNESIATPPPKWFWVVSSIALVWNLLGVMAFVTQMTMDPAALAELSDAQRNFYETTPVWATLAFAVVVFGGTLGCVALLLRKSWAFLMLAICLAGIVVQISHSLFIGNGVEVFGPQGLILPALTFGIGVILVWFAIYSAKQGWLSA